MLLNKDKSLGKVDCFDNQMTLKLVYDSKTVALPNYQDI